MCFLDDFLAYGNNSKNIRKTAGKAKIRSARRNVKAAWEDYRRVLGRLQGRKQEAGASEKEGWSSTPTPVGRRIASRIPPGRIDWVVGGRVVFFVLVVFSVFYVFVGLVAVLGCLLVVWLLGCWFEQPNNPKKQPPNNPMIRQPSYQTTQEHNNPTTQTNRFLTKKSKRQTTKNIRKSSQGDPNWSQN